MKHLLAPILAVVLLLGAAPRVQAGSLEDYRACMTACDSSFIAPDSSGGSCADSLARMADDLQKFFELLNVPRLCKGRFVDACEKWRTETVEKLSALIPMLQKLQFCGEVDAAGMAPLLTPFDTSLTCKGDGVYSDLHDYIGSNREILESLTALGSNYSYELSRFDPNTDYAERTPNCEGGTASPVYIDTLLRFYNSLASLSEVKACAASCRKPSEALTRLEGTLGSIATLEKSLAALHTQLAAAQASRNEGLAKQAVEIHPCATFTKLGAALDALDGELGAVRKNAETQNAGEPQAEQVAALGQDLTRIEAALVGIQLAAAAQTCADEDRKALTLEERKRALVDRLAKDPAIGLEALETFERGLADGKKCRWTLECRIPGLCTKGKCQGGNLALTLTDQIAALKKAATDVLQVKIYGDDGLRPEAEAEIAAIEGDANTQVAFLEGVKWGEKLQVWQASFVKSVAARTKVLTGQAQRTLEELSEVDETAALNPKKCKSSQGRLKGLIKDFEGLAAGLGSLDPVGNSRWVYVQLGRISSMASRIEQVQKECQEDCVEGGFNFKPLLWGAAALLLAALAFLAGRRLHRDLRKYRPRKRHHHHQTRHHSADKTSLPHRNY
jgi:hypothetical protein